MIFLPMSHCPSPRPLSLQYFSCLVGKPLFFPSCFPSLSLFPSPRVTILRTSSVCVRPLLITCPYQFYRLCEFFGILHHSPVPRMCSFLILSLRVAPHIHISFTSICFSCRFIVAHVSAPCSTCTSGLITVLVSKGLLELNGLLTNN